MTWGFRLLATTESPLLVLSEALLFIIRRTVKITRLTEKDSFNSLRTESIWLWVLASTWEIDRHLPWHHKKLILPRLYGSGNTVKTGVSRKQVRTPWFFSSVLIAEGKLLPEDEQGEKARSFCGSVCPASPLWPGRLGNVAEFTAATQAYRKIWALPSFFPAAV